MGTKKGMARKGKFAGSRKAYDDTPDSKKHQVHQLPEKRESQPKKEWLEKELSLVQD